MNRLSFSRRTVALSYPCTTTFQIQNQILCGHCSFITESSIREVMKNKEKIRASFSVASQTANVTAIAPNKVLMKVEKALNFWLEDMNRKRVPLDGKLLRQKTLSLY